MFLDPRNLREQRTIWHRVYAVLSFGDPDDAFTHRCHALAVADAVDRHGRQFEDLRDANFCLGDDDTTWGSSVQYGEAVSAGSGLGEALSRVVAYATLADVMRAVHNERDDWLRARQTPGGHHWFNSRNAPGRDYTFALNDASWITTT